MCLKRNHWKVRISDVTISDIYNSNWICPIQLSEEMLKEDIAMRNGILRRRFLRELNNLKRVADYSSCDPTNLNEFLQVNLNSILAYFTIPSFPFHFLLFLFSLNRLFFYFSLFLPLYLFLTMLWIFPLISFCFSLLLYF